MCGIAGLLTLTDSPLPQLEQSLRSMSGALAHRGPDGTGLWSSQDQRIGFAHTRLAIIDLTTEGHQPMISERGNALIFNGEIYNFRELQKKYDLNLPPSDTAVLLALLDRYGTRILPELRGFFTFAYWRDDEKRLLIARDAIGKKPLYYASRNGRFAFASEACALVKSGFIEPDISVDAVGSYLARYAVPHPLGILDSVNVLGAGESMLVQNGSLTISKWYELPKYHPVSISYKDAVRETRRLLEESVRYRLVSDVPVGAFLSGGLDSNAIVGLMAREVSHPIETFSIGFKSSHVESEADLARMAAMHYGTRHHETILSDADVAALLPDFFRAMDSPTGDGLNTFLVAHATKQANPSLKVVLSGVGGDELFLGYRKHRWLAKNRKLAKIIWSLPETVRQLFASTLPKDSGNRFGIALRALLDPGNIRVLFSPKDIDHLLGDRTYGTYRSYKSHRAHEMLEELLRNDFQYYLHDTLLRDLDQMTMAHPLEARAPMLDKQLVEFAWQLPISIKSFGRSKQLLSDAVKDIIPAELVTKPKTGFELPMRAWLLRGALRPWLEPLATGDMMLVRQGVLQKEAVQHVHRDFVQGRSHYLMPWSIIALEWYYRSLIENSGLC